MFGRNIIFIFLMIFLLGCATTQTKQPQDLKKLQDRVASLEQELQRKDEKIKTLEDGLNPKKPTVVVFNSDSTESFSPTIKKEESFRPPTDLQIQKALKNAGFYKGAVDGKIGPKTSQAIKEFQRQKGLNPDGKVGAKTWAALKSFLN